MYAGDQDQTNKFRLIFRIISHGNNIVMALEYKIRGDSQFNVGSHILNKLFPPRGDVSFLLERKRDSG